MTDVLQKIPWKEVLKIVGILAASAGVGGMTSHKSNDVLENDVEHITKNIEYMREDLKDLKETINLRFDRVSEAINDLNRQD